MSDLIKRLRSPFELWYHEMVALRQAAASALEQQAGEIERLKALISRADTDVMDGIDKLRAENAELRRVVELACNTIAPGGLYAELHSKLMAAMEGKK